MRAVIAPNPGGPEALVVAHMLGASLLVVALTQGLLGLRER